MQAIAFWSLSMLLQSWPVPSKPFLTPFDLAWSENLRQLQARPQPFYLSEEVVSQLCRSSLKQHAKSLRAEKRAREREREREGEREGEGERERGGEREKKKLTSNIPQPSLGRDSLGLGTPGAGHSGDTLGLGTPGRLWGWALQGHCRVGYSRDTLGLGRPGEEETPGEERS